MKKWLFVGLLLFGGIVVNSEVYGQEQKDVEKENRMLVTSDTQNAKQGKVTKVFVGRGDAEKERQRQLRNYRYSRLEPVGLYAEKGDTLTVEVIGHEQLELVIGTNERNTQKNYALPAETNSITVENEGPLYITNKSEKEGAIVSISGATGEMPYFDLNSTDVEDFQKQMVEKTTAKDVQLVSNKAIITVSYEQAKKHLGNPKELMEYYDKFLLAQDRVSGLHPLLGIAPLSTTSPHDVDRHFQHFVEVSRGYMFATHEYMGFNGDAALNRLLKTNNGWGVWHESGHQRQQAPWRWSSVIESTVNIYSMAAEKEINGKITALDKYYPQMHAYLKSENKNFETQSNDLKMVMFGQLANTFGEDFYPILHQYYREKQLSYSSDTERIQNFVLNVSTITGYNMVPYFEQWGFDIASTTREKIVQYPNLPEKIWLNDNQITKKLPMRFIENISFSEGLISVELVTNYGKDIFQGQKLVLLKNGKYVSELTNKKPFYSFLHNNFWKTADNLKPTDEIRIEVRNTAGTFQIYKGSMITEKLKNQLMEYLNLEEKIGTILDPSLLADLREQINKLTDNESKEKLFELFEMVEQKYLEYLVKDIRLDKKGLLVEFADDKFKGYSKIVITENGKYIAEIAKGKPHYGFLHENTLSIPNYLSTQNKYAVQFRLPYKTYIIGMNLFEGSLLRKQIEELFVTENQLKLDVTQVKLDDLHAKVNQLTGKVYEELNEKIKRAQQLFLEGLISNVYFSNDRLSITFTANLYKDYKIVVLENERYLAEVTNGKPYYGTLIGSTFRPQEKVTVGSVYEVEVRHTSGVYKIKKIKYNKTA